MTRNFIHKIYDYKCLVYKDLTNLHYFISDNNNLYTISDKIEYHTSTTHTLKINFHQFPNTPLHATITFVILSRILYREPYSNCTKNSYTVVLDLYAFIENVFHKVIDDLRHNVVVFNIDTYYDVLQNYTNFLKYKVNDLNIFYTHLNRRDYYRFSYYKNLFHLRHLNIFLYYDFKIHFKVIFNGNLFRLYHLSVIRKYSVYRIHDFLYFFVEDPKPSITFYIYFF